MCTGLQKSYRPGIRESLSNRYKFTRHICDNSAIMQLLGEIPRDNYRRKAEELGEQEMKRMQDVELNWKWFQVRELTTVESKSWFNHWVNRFHYDSRIYSDIYDAYKKPSEAKVSVWNEWVSWANDVNIFDDFYEVKNLSICATTNQMFTVCAIIREFDYDESGNCLTVATYIMVATKYHNYLYLLTSDEDGEDVAICW